MAFVVLGLGVIASVFGLLALAVAIPKPRFGLILAVLALAAACSVPGSGALGTVYGRKQTDDAVSGAAIDASQRERIREAGYAEAGQCTTLGAGIGALPTLLSLAALGLAVLRRRAKSDAPSLG